jgi:hypothetical protein
MPSRGSLAYALVCLLGSEEFISCSLCLPAMHLTQTPFLHFMDLLKKNLTKVQCITACHTHHLPRLWTSHYEALFSNTKLMVTPCMCVLLHVVPSTCHTLFSSFYQQATLSSGVTVGDFS